MSHIIYAFDLSEAKPLEGGEAVKKALADTKKHIWIHFDYHHDDTLPYLNEMGIHEEYLEILMNEDTRPRYLAGDDVEAALMLLRGANFNENAKSEDMVSLRLFCKNNNLITLRLRKVFAVEDTYNELVTDKKPCRTTDVWFTIMEKLVIRLTPILGNLEEQLDKIDSNRPKDLMQAERDVVHLRQQLIGFYRFIKPQTEAIDELSKNPPSFFTKADKKDVVEILDKQRRILEWIDALRDQANVVHEQVMSYSSHKMNKITYILTIVAGIFLPLNFIGALLGANVGGVPWSDNPDGFYIMSAILFGLALVQYILMRMFRWF